MMCPAEPGHQRDLLWRGVPEYLALTVLVMQCVVLLTLVGTFAEAMVSCGTSRHGHQSSLNLCHSPR